MIASSAPSKYTGEFQCAPAPASCLHFTCQLLSRDHSWSPAGQREIFQVLAGGGDREGSGHPTGPAAVGQGQGAVVALLVPCQSSSHLRPPVYFIVSQSIHSLQLDHRGFGHVRTQAIVKDAGVSTPLLRHNRSPLVCHTLWHVGISECARRHL